MVLVKARRNPQMTAIAASNRQHSALSPHETRNSLVTVVYVDRFTEASERTHGRVKATVNGCHQRNSLYVPTMSDRCNRRQNMNQFVKRGLQITAVSAAAIVVCSIVVVTYLAYAGTPSKSRFMTFEGYIELPKSGLLNVLDYLTIDGKTLFVTSESSGALFKISLDPNRPSASSVSELRGTGAAHSVALLPEANVAFITRSEENTVDVFDPQSLQKRESIPVADDADAILYVPSVKLMDVANGDAHLATLIDPVKRTIFGAISLPGKPEFAALHP